VGFASPEEIPQELLQLAHGLEDNLEASGFAFDELPYKPHVTLLRNTRCTTQVPFVPVTWKVNEFVLVASSTTDHGPIYQLLGRWPLKP
jgi:RNA 2',3'-cyclic 3'-phosphodiesterase